MSYVTRLERERDRKNVLACKTDRKCLSEREREKKKNVLACKTESECHMCFGVHGRVCVREREND